MTEEIKDVSKEQLIFTMKFILEMSQNILENYDKKRINIGGSEMIVYDLTDYNDLVIFLNHFCNYCIKNRYNSDKESFYSTVFAPCFIKIYEKVNINASSNPEKLMNTFFARNYISSFLQKLKWE